MIDFGKMEKTEQPIIVGQDLIAVKKTIRDNYMPQIEKIKTETLEQKIETNEDEKEAIIKIGQVKTLMVNLDDHRKETIKEKDKFVRDVNKFVKPFRDNLGEIVTALNKKITDYGWAKRKAQQEKEKEEQHAAMELQKKVEVEAIKLNLDPPEMAPIPILPINQVVRTETGTSAHLRMEWKLIEIIDFSIVPDEYKILDEKKIKASIKAGIREISGLKIEEMPVTVIRR